MSINNPLTGRQLKVGSKTYGKLLAKGIIKETPPTTFTGTPELDIQILSYLSDLDFSNACKGNTYLSSLCKNDYVWRLRFLHKYNLTKFNKGDNVTFRKIYIALDKSDEDGLIWAAKRGHLEVVKLLLEQGVAVDTDDENSLKQAVFYGHLDVVKLLLKYGADIHDEHDLAFRIAAQKGYLDIVKYLIEEGADIHALDDEYPYTDDALKWAAEEGHLGVIKLLLTHGAALPDVNDYTNIYEAILAAVENDHTKIAKLLLRTIKESPEIGDDDYIITEAFKIAAERNHLELLHLLLDNKADIHDDNDYALRSSVSNKHLDVVNFLLDNGADISVLTKKELEYIKKKGILK